jgi:hypothetical protein
MGRPRKNPSDHRNPARSLTTAEMFYVEKMGETMKVEDIAKALGKPVELIQAFADDWNEKHPPVKDVPRTRKMMQRVHGTVGMTEAASMAGDDAKGRANTKLVAIEEAMRAGRTEEAARLREEYDRENELKRQEKVRNKYNQIVHKIFPED